MDRKPKPTDAAAAAQASTEAPAAVPDVVANATPATDTTFEPAPVESAVPKSDVPSRSLLPEPEFVQAEAAPLVQQQADELAPVAAPVEATTAPVESAPTEAKPAEEAAFIEVWRPAGRSERRPHRPRRQHRQQQTQVVEAEGTAATPAEGGAAVSASTDTAAPTRGPRRPRRERGEGADREKRQDRHERQQRVEKQGERAERHDRGPRRDRPRRERGDTVDRAERERYYAKPFGNSGAREKQPDPNSPFAKLAALKQQHEQRGKDPS